MFYTIYKTTNLVTNRYYLGVHKTENPWDDYLGSGTYILRAVEKYGSKHFQKDVLFVYDETNRESAMAKENELIQCYRVDPFCMNLRKGGEGGFDYINENGLQKEAARKQGFIQGRKNSESGFIQRLGRVAGRKAVDSGRLAGYRTLEHQTRAGRLQGIKNRENGHLARIRTPQVLEKAHRAGGRKAVESGQTASLNHIRWHVRRGLTLPSCSICLQAG